MIILKYLPFKYQNITTRTRAACLFFLFRRHLFLCSFDKNGFSLIFLTMGDAWVELLVTNDEIEAEMIKDLLESGGIPVVIRSSKVRPYPVSIGKMGEVKLLVRREDREAAEDVLKRD